MAHQITVFAQNKPGRIEKVTRVLEDAGVNIRAITIATSDSFGIIKLLVDAPGRAYESLSAAGLSVYQREIIAVLMDDSPGGLHRIAEILGGEGINIEGAYGFVVEDKKQAVLVIEVEKIPEATGLLRARGLATLTDEEIYAL